RGHPAVSATTSHKSERSSHSTVASDEASSINPVERQILERKWFYSFELPGGNRTPCYVSPEVRKFHADRLAMIFSVLTPMFGQNWKEIRCLDVGCNQGFFSVALAERGSGRVQGIDAREQNITDAKLICEVFDLSNLEFTVADWLEINSTEWEKFDVTLMLSLVFWLENPIDALRKARALTRRVLLVETPVAPEISGQIDWGSYQTQKTVQGSFALLDQSMEMTLPI